MLLLLLLLLQSLDCRKNGYKFSTQLEVLTPFFWLARCKTNALETAIDLPQTNKLAANVCVCVCDFCVCVAFLSFLSSDLRLHCITGLWRCVNEAIAKCTHLSYEHEIMRMCHQVCNRWQPHFIPLDLAAKQVGA